MACKAGEIETIDYDESGYGLPICVKGNNPNGKSGSVWDQWDKIMEAADKILQGAEIITGNKATKTQKKGGFGGDVITYDRNGLPTRNNDVEATPSVFDNKLVLIGGGLLLAAFVFLIIKAFSKKADAASVVAPPIK